MNTSKMMPFIGIDLGTTNSCVATVQQGEAVVIANQHGSRTTPSCVAFTDKKRLIGMEAQRQSSSNPANTVYDAKRLIGRSSDEPAVKNDKRRWPFEVIDDEGKPKIQVKYKNQPRIYAPEEISSMVLSRMKQYAETFIGEGVLGAVITVPAYFNDAQRRATKDAAIIAEIDVLGLLNEPTAAAIAYGLQENVEVKRNVLIFDLGGGTFDVTVLTIHKENFEVKATNGDTHLGGQDFCNRLFNHFASVIAQKNGVDIKEDMKATSRLVEACEKAKNALSTAMVADIHVDGLLGGEDFKTHIRRDRFEQLNDDLFRGTLETVEKALECADMRREEIDEVVLVGGSTRIPMIQKMLADYFHEKKICKTINPDEAVALGAAAYAASLSGNPTSGMTKFNLKDVTPLSLGIETRGEVMSVVVPRNTQIPVKKSHIFTTSYDNQDIVNFRVFEGERPNTKQNHLLGNFRLEGIPPAPAGKPTFDTCFDIDNDGVLTVTAVEKGRQNKGSVTITKEGRQKDEEEIQRMVNEARKFREEDEDWRERAKVVNNLERVAGKAKRVIGQRGQLSEDERERMLAKCDEVLRASPTQQQELTVEQLTDKVNELKAMVGDLE